MPRILKICLPIIAIAGFFLLHTACNTARRLADQNISSIYAISDVSPIPEYILYQHATDSLRIFFSIPARSGQGTNNTQRGDGFIIHSNLGSVENRNIIYDSATYYIIPEDSIINRSALNGNIEIFTGEPAGKLLSLILKDPGTGSENEHFFILPASWPPTTTHFLPVDLKGQPLNHKNISTSEKFYVKSSIITDQTIRVRYYRDEFPAAYPPFANIPFQNFNYEADSLFEISFSGSQTGVLHFRKPGIYHFNADTTTRTGFTIFARDYPFPWIAQSVQMIPPLKYITSDKEYRDLENAPDAKEAVDAFWVANAGNELRAGKLIGEYYRRVEKANYLFTSFQDGWKTDRGMIFIMFGPPSIVQRNEHSEVWTYGESRHLLSFSFVFIKIKNPFTDNDYMLERSPNYKTGWYQMVNSWRR